MKLFRREWVFPLLMVAFVSASARATSPSMGELSSQAAVDLHCNSVAITPSSATQFLATGCGQDRTYTCGEDGSCTLDSDGSGGHYTSGSGDSSGDDEAAAAIAESIMELGCACASAAASHGGGHHHASGSHKKK